jgi:hypothetical protein
MGAACRLLVGLLDEQSMLMTPCRNVNRNVAGVVTLRAQWVAGVEGIVLTPQQMSDFIKNVLALCPQK